MKPETRGNAAPPRPLLSAFIALFALLLPAVGTAATVWTGAPVAFTKADFADPNDPASQDAITPLVALTRADFQGIYNAVSETSYSAFSSPAGTEWAFTLNNPALDPSEVVASNFAALTFEVWQDAVLTTPPVSVGEPGVLHLIAEDIYLDIIFLSWTSLASGGGFSYERATPAPEPASALLLLVGLAPLLAWRPAAAARHASKSAV